MIHSLLYELLCIFSSQYYYSWSIEPSNCDKTSYPCLAKCFVNYNKDQCNSCNLTCGKLIYSYKLICIILKVLMIAPIVIQMVARHSACWKTLHQVINIDNIYMYYNYYNYRLLRWLGCFCRIYIFTCNCFTLHNDLCVSPL